MSAITSVNFPNRILYTPPAEACQQDAAPDLAHSPVTAWHKRVGVDFATAKPEKARKIPEFEELPDTDAMGEIEACSLESVRSFVQLRPLAEQAQEHISPLGERYITIQDQKYPIDALTDEVIALIRMRCNFGEKERAHGKKIAERITVLYKQNDERLKKMGLLTRIRTFVQGLKHSGLTTFPLSETRWMWEDNKFHKGKLKNGQTLGYRCIFELYTRRQYAGVFKQFPSDDLKLKLKLAYDKAEVYSDMYYLPPKNLTKTQE